MNNLSFVEDHKDRGEWTPPTYKLAPFTCEQLETALDSRRLEVQWRNGKWYAVRRNGATQLWKTRPAWFRIPCKTGFRECFAIGDPSRTTVSHHPDSPYLRIKETEI